jgi:sulfotransferase
LHTVRRKVEPVEHQPIIPHDIFGRFANEAFWLDPKNNVNQVPIV